MGECIKIFQVNQIVPDYIQYACQAPRNKIHGRDFYKIIGAKGGRASHTGGFATSHEWAVECGRKSAIARYGIKKEEA